MSTLASLALQQAIFARLSGDAGLMAAVSGIFDHVPANATLPYLRLAAAAASDWSTKSFSGQRHRIAVQIFSEARGDSEAKTLADLVHALLDGASLTLAGHQLVRLGFESLQMLREPDGIRQALLRFEALTHPL
ncbi:MAG: DUF3168 domain-containing protein [Rhodothalassiaceae bacterium]